MHTRKALLFTLGGISLVVAAVTSATGCASSKEDTGSAASELRTPIPIFRAVASKEAQKELNVHEWRVYRGKHEHIVTGYDASGHAVSGFALGAYAHTSKTASHMRLRMLDGSRFAVRPVFDGKSATSGAMSAKSASFVTRALSDFSQFGASPTGTQSITLHGGQGEGLRVLGLTGNDACMSAIMTLVQDAVPCGMSIASAIEAATSKSGSGTTTTTTTNPVSATTITQCVKAAGDVLTVITSCQSGSTSSGGVSLPTPTPSSTSTSSTGSTGTGTGTGSGTGNTPIPAPSGSVAYDPGIDPKLQLDQAAADQTCASCPKGSDDGTDVDPDTSTGGVALGTDTGPDDFEE